MNVCKRRLKSQTGLSMSECIVGLSADLKIGNHRFWQPVATWLLETTSTFSVSLYERSDIIILVGLGFCCSFVFIWRWLRLKRWGCRWR